VVLSLSTHEGELRYADTAQQDPQNRPRRSHRAFHLGENRRRREGTVTIVTIKTLGWVARRGRSCRLRPLEPRCAVAHGLPRLRREFCLKAVVSVRDAILPKKEQEARAILVGVPALLSRYLRG
jgi:hypothetical protein